MFQNLFSPGRINKLTLKNRIIFPVMAMHFDHPSGEASRDTIALFARLARGGAGMLMTNHMRPLALKHRPKLETLSLHQKQMTVPPGRIDLRKQVSRVAWAPLEPLPALNPKIYNLVEAVHVNGSRICAGLSSIPTGWVLENYDPDDPDHQNISLFNKMPASEIEESIREFATVAGELKEIGFDAIEIAPGYPGDCFSLAHFNKRQDKYGGASLETRLRYHQELIQATRQEVGEDFPLILLIDADHFGARGWRTLDETRVLVKKFEEWGVDCVRARLGGSVRVEYDIAPMYLPKGIGIPAAAGLKEVIKIPVVACTKLSDPNLAEKVLEEGKADFVAIGRGLIADHDLPNKVRTGHADRIRKCMSCNIGCLGNLVNLPRRPSRCTVNPMFGHEADLPDKVGPATEKHKVVVVGAGPGGMSAALTAAQRGHSVTLFEKTGALGGGGHFRLACIPPYKDELLGITEFYRREFADLEGIRVTYGTEATADIVLNEMPDAVILATGARASIPGIPGVHSPGVMTYEDVLLGSRTVGERVVVIGGGGVGCEVSLHLLLKTGRQVTVLEMLDRMADQVEVATRNCLMEKLNAAGARMIVGAHVTSISGSEVFYRQSGQEARLSADSIIMATGASPSGQLYDVLAHKVPVVQVVGDAKEPRQIIDAVSEGFWASYYL